VRGKELKGVRSGPGRTNPFIDVKTCKFDRIVIPWMKLVIQLTFQFFGGPLWLDGLIRGKEAS